MALTQVAMDCGEGIRTTDSIGGCNSYACTVIDTDSRFQSQQFSLMYRFQLLADTTPGGTGLVGCADTNGDPRRFWLYITGDSDEHICGFVVDTDNCGFNIVTDYRVPRDLVEHSIAVTYDADGDWVFYFDGVQVDTGVAPCNDMSGPADTGDRFVLIGNNLFDGSEWWKFDRIMYTNAIVPASQILAIHTSCEEI